jgi:hypothetical protein
MRRDLRQPRHETGNLGAQLLTAPRLYERRSLATFHSGCGCGFIRRGTLFCSVRFETRNWSYLEKAGAEKARIFRRDRAASKSAGALQAGGCEGPAGLARDGTFRHRNRRGNEPRRRQTCGLVAPRCPLRARLRLDFLERLPLPDVGPSERGVRPWAGALAPLALGRCVLTKSGLPAREAGSLSARTPAPPGFRAGVSYQD